MCEKTQLATALSSFYTPPEQFLAEKKEVLKKWKKIKDYTINDIKQQSKLKTQVVLFKTNWCSHCVQFEPVWNSLVTKNQSVGWNEINCELPGAGKLMQELGIQGYPTIVKFQNEQIKKDLQRPYTLDTVLEWLQRGNSKELK